MRDCRYVGRSLGSDCRTARPWKGPYIQAKGGAPREVRTPNLLIRSQVLYPVELSAHPRVGKYSGFGANRNWLKGRGVPGVYRRAALVVAFPSLVGPFV